MSCTLTLTVVSWDISDMVLQPPSHMIVTLTGSLKGLFCIALSSICARVIILQADDAIILGCDVMNCNRTTNPNSLHPDFLWEETEFGPLVLYLGTSWFSWNHQYLWFECICRLDTYNNNHHLRQFLHLLNYNSCHYALTKIIYIYIDTYTYMYI